MLAIPKKIHPESRKPEILFHLPFGDKIGRRALKDLRDAVAALLPTELSEEICRQMLDSLPPREARYIICKLNNCLAVAGESPEIYFWNWAMVMVVHTLRRYKGKKPAADDPDKIRLWRGSHPSDLMRKIVFEGTAVGTLITWPRSQSHATE